MCCRSTLVVFTGMCTCTLICKVCCVLGEGCMHTTTAFSFAARAHTHTHTRTHTNANSHTNCLNMSQERKQLSECCGSCSARASFWRSSYKMKKKTILYVFSIEFVQNDFAFSFCTLGSCKMNSAYKIFNIYFCLLFLVI